MHARTLHCQSDRVERNIIFIGKRTIPILYRVNNSKRPATPTNGRKPSLIKMIDVN